MNLRKLLFILSIANALLTCLSSEVKSVPKKGSPLVAHFFKTNEKKELTDSNLSKPKFHMATPNSSNSTSNKTSTNSIGLFATSPISNSSSLGQLNIGTISVLAETVSKQTDRYHEEIDPGKTEFADRADNISLLYKNLMDSIYSFLSHNKTDREKRNKVNSTALIEPRDDNFKGVLNGAAGFLTYLIDDLGKAYPANSDNSIISKESAQLANRKSLLDRHQFNPFKGRFSTTTLKSYDYLEHYGDEYIDEDSYVIETASSMLFNEEEQESLGVTEMMNYLAAKNTDSNDEKVTGQLKEPVVKCQNFHGKDIRPNNKIQVTRKTSQTTIAKALRDEHIIQLVDEEIFRVLEVLKAGLNSEFIMNKVKSSRNSVNDLNDEAASTEGRLDEFYKYPFFRNRGTAMGQDVNRKDGAQPSSDFVIVRNGKLLDRGKIPAARKNHYKSLSKNPISKPIPELKGSLKEREKSELFWKLYKPECRLKNRIKSQFHFPSQNNFESQLPAPDNSLDEESTQNKSKQDISLVNETSKKFAITNKEFVFMKSSTDKSDMKKSNVDLVGQQIQTSESEVEITPKESRQEFVTLVIPASDIKELSNQIEKRYRKLTTENSLKSTKKFFYFKRRDSTAKTKSSMNLSKNVMFVNQLDTDIDPNKRDQENPLDNSELFYLPSDDFAYELNDKLEKLPNSEGSRERIQLEPNLDYEFINRIPPKIGKLAKKSFLDYGDRDYSLVRKQIADNDIIRKYGGAESRIKDGMSYFNSDVLNQKRRNENYRRNNLFLNNKKKDPRYIDSSGHLHTRFRRNIFTSNKNK